MEEEKEIVEEPKEEINEETKEEVQEEVKEDKVGKKKSKLPIIIVVIVLCLALGIGGVFTYKKFGGSDSGTNTKTSNKVDDKKDDKEKDVEKDKDIDPEELSKECDSLKPDFKFLKYNSNTDTYEAKVSYDKIHDVLSDYFEYGGSGSSCFNISIKSDIKLGSETHTLEYKKAAGNWTSYTYYDDKELYTVALSQPYPDLSVKNNKLYVAYYSCDVADGCPEFYYVNDKGELAEDEGEEVKVNVTEMNDKLEKLNLYLQFGLDSQRNGNYYKFEEGVLDPGKLNEYDFVFLYTVQNSKNVLEDEDVANKFGLEAATGLRAVPLEEYKKNYESFYFYTLYEDDIKDNKGYTKQIKDGYVIGSVWTGLYNLGTKLTFKSFRKVGFRYFLYAEVSYFNENTESYDKSKDVLKLELEENDDSDLYCIYSIKLIKG